MSPIVPLTAVALTLFTMDAEPMEGNRGTSISDTCATAKTSTSVSGNLLNTDWLAAAACFAWRSCFVSASSDQSKDQAQGLLFVFRISSSNLIHWCNWWTNVDWRGDCILSTAWSIRNSIWRSLLCPEANNRLNSAGMFCVWDSMKASWPRRRSHSTLQNAVLGLPPSRRGVDCSGAQSLPWKVRTRATSDVHWCDPLQ